jgi:hypothetical protein
MPSAPARARELIEQYTCFGEPKSDIPHRSGTSFPYREPSRRLPVRIYGRDADKQKSARR